MPRALSQETIALMKRLRATGIGVEAVARGLGTSVAAVTARYRNYRVRSPRRRATFSSVLLLYAQHLQAHGSFTRRGYDTPEAKFRRSLETWLRMPELRAFCLGLVRTKYLLLVPELSEDKRGYYDLLCFLFYGPARSVKERDLVAQADAHLQEYLTRVAEGVSPAESSAELQRLLTRQILAEYRADIAPTWTEEVYTLIDDALSSLTERERDALRLLFGIDSPRHTREEVATKYGLSQTRIRQIELRALRRLHRGQRMRFLRLCITAEGTSLQANLRARLDLEHLRETAIQRGIEAQLLVAAFDPKIFERSIDEIELSVRTYNCLRNAGIRTIGQLVQWSEQELLKTKWFGRRSLNEIKELLGGFGLRLSMSRETIDRIKAAAAPAPDEPRR